VGGVESQNGQILSVRATGRRSPGSGAYAGGSILGPVSAQGNIGMVSASGGNLSGDVSSAAGTVRSVMVRGAYDAATRQWLEGDLTGSVSAALGGTTVNVGGDLTGDLTYGGKLSTVMVRGTMQGSAVNVTGRLNGITVFEDMVNSNVTAGELLRVTVRGQIQEVAGDGEDEIHALAGRLTVRDVDERALIEAGTPAEIGGVECWVG